MCGRLLNQQPGVWAVIADTMREAEAKMAKAFVLIAVLGAWTYQYR